MIISVNWLKKFTDIDMPVDELVQLVGARLVEIEEVIDLGAKYEGVTVARVVMCEKLEDSDHLSITKLDDGGVVKSVERDENGYVQVICGAPNVRAGLLIAWLPPRSVVPQTFGAEEPFVLGTRKLRGAISNGMIASARELDLFDDHTGILEIDKDVAPGTSFAEAYELNDYLLDIENKSLTHRPDAFGVVGFAREVAGIQGKTFKTPEWLLDTMPVFDEKAEGFDLKVTIDDKELSSRYAAVLMGGVNGSVASPLEMQTYLARVGVRPISAVVDITNYLMLLTGQPLHAFDYDKVAAISDGTPDIHVRAGRDNETLELLDGRMITLTPDDIVIAAGETAIALGGAMGGAATEIDSSTKTIILESATFNLYNLRATQMRHGIFSEAITRFTKGQPAELTLPVLKNAAEMMTKYAGAKQISGVVEDYSVKAETRTVMLTVSKVNDVLGAKLASEEVIGTLETTEFSVREESDILQVAPPYWRRDISIAEDLIEEIGRLRGFDSIVPTLPRRDFKAVRPSSLDTLKFEIRQVLARAGGNEVLSYNFVHGDVMKKAGQMPGNSYRITNSISPDLQYYRQSLTPSLLSMVHGNIKQGFDEFALFEINKVHPKSLGMTEEGLPVELHSLGMTYASDRPQSGAPYYKAKAVLEYLASSFGFRVLFSPVDEMHTFTAPFEPKSSALVCDEMTKKVLGVVGEYKKSVSRQFKLPEYTAGFELDVTVLQAAMAAQPNTYRPLSRYPGAERDICFRVRTSVSYEQVVRAASEALIAEPLEHAIEPIDIYQASETDDAKNITIRIKLTSHDHTLTSEEITAAVEKTVTRVSSQLGAEVI